MDKNKSSISISREFIKLVSDVLELGFDGVLYSFIPKPIYANKEIQPRLEYSKRFVPYVSHYLKHDYGRNDFVIRLCSEGRSEPIDWWEEINAGNLSDAERVVTEDAKNLFGIHEGLSIPVPSGKFAIAGISVICIKEDADYFQKIKHESLNTLQTYANAYHANVVQSHKKMQSFIYPLIDSLSDTKKKVLKHLISGQPMKTIPHNYGISQRFAEKTLIGIRKDFGNISTNELMYMLGMINMDEYL